ncbi:MAG: sensor histidine kinase [Anaerolineaceae bacterium]|nr:sensor histidine kinase [Anaerolineaceae bacterium]
MNHRLQIKNEQIEPGLLKLFRIYSLIITIVTLANGIGSYFDPLVDKTAFIHLSILGFVLLDLYLFDRRLLRTFKGAYLALGLTIFILSTLLIQRRSVDFLVTPNIWMMQYFSFGFGMFFIPLLIAAWQYGVPGTLGFIGLTVLLELISPLVQPIHVEYYLLVGLVLFRAVNFLVVGLIISRLMDAQRKKHDHLAVANQQLAHYASTLEQLAVSRERNRLARDLHDTLAHTLSGVSVQLEAVRALWNSDEPQAKSILNQALLDTRSGLSDTRRALQDLRSEPLEDLGLLLAIENLSQSFEERNQVEVKLSLPEKIDNLSISAQNCLYRSTQEALANIERHARAKLAQIHLQMLDTNEIWLHIEDDGVGFDPKENPEEGHFGLRGLRERARLNNGHVEIHSLPNAGTQIDLYIPEES